MNAGLTLLAAAAGVVMAGVVLWPLRGRGRAGFAMACLCVGLASASLYLLVGDPRAARQAPPPSLAELRDGVQALERSLQQEPQRADGWALLGRSRTELGQAGAAADAFARAAALAPDDAGILVEAAQARAQAHPAKRFDDTSLAWLQHAVQVQPDAERAAWLLGIALRQRGRDPEAVAVWTALLPRLQSGAAAALKEQIAIAGGRSEIPAAGTSQPPGTSVSLTVRLSLPAGFDAARWPKDAAVFVLARVPGGAPMPVAVRRFALDAMPETVILRDADSPMPTQPLSAHPKVEVLARLSRSGTAATADGDLKSEPITVTLPNNGVVDVALH